MLIGPLFTREAVTSPRRLRHYLLRGGYQVILFVLIWTAWQEIVGGQRVLNIGDVARFGFLLFQILGLLQLFLVLFLAPLSVASSVSQEKDRRTLILLLMTDLTNRELVLGKLFSGLMPVGAMLAGALPVFLLCMLLGGVSWSQVAVAFLVTAAAGLAFGSLGVTIAFWREKTFQTLALVVLTVVLCLVLGEAVPFLVPQDGLLGISGDQWATLLNPRKAILGVLDGDPLDRSRWTVPVVGHPSFGFMGLAILAGVALNLVTISLVRVWNPSNEAWTPREEPEEEPSGALFAEPARVGTAEGLAPASSLNPGRGPVAEDWTSSVGSVAGWEGARITGSWSWSKLRERRRGPEQSNQRKRRQVWSNPVLWREMCTRAYGRRPILIKAAYLLLFLLMCGFLYMRQGAEEEHRLLPAPALAFVVVSVVSLLILNAQAGASVSTERDSGALELLLVTDVTPREFVYGKLGGSLYNSKEILLLPLGMAGYFWLSGQVTLEHLVYLVLGPLVLYGFAAMLGIHAGMSFQNSRTAIANSLGTVFFLFVGIFICINLIIAAGGSFERALLSFLVFILGGGVGLFASWGAKNPSGAIFLAAMACPFLTFYAIINYRVGATLGVFLVVGAAYGWAVASMLIPAIHEFDVALGRTTPDQES